MAVGRQHLVRILVEYLSGESVFQVSGIEGSVKESDSESESRRSWGFTRNHTIYSPMDYMTQGWTFQAIQTLDNTNPLS